MKRITDYLHAHALQFLGMFIILGASAAGLIDPVSAMAGAMILHTEPTDMEKILAATTGEVKNFITKQIAAAGEMQTKQGELQARLLELEQKAARRPGVGSFGGGGGDDAASQGERVPFSVRLADGSVVPVFTKAARVSNHYPIDSTQGEPFAIGEWVRDLMTGRKAASSSALVPVGVSAQIIDDVRAAAVIIQAGAGTIIFDGPTIMARITGDPTIYEHVEAVADISESDITVVPVTLNPKTLAALIPLSMEVVADSPNLDAVLNTALAGAFASKLDALAIAVILADAAIPSTAAGSDPATWANVLSAVGLAMVANQPVPTAMITNTADFIARASQLASTAGSWLGKPPALASMLELPTSALADGLAIYGGFDLGFAIALRQELKLEIVRYAKPTSASHVLVATMRAAGVVLQPKRLFIQEQAPST